MLAVDTSTSMKALDFTIGDNRYDRLTVVKAVIRDFIEKRLDDRLGIVIFGTDSFTQAPLTHDHDVLIKFLDKIEIGMAGGATAIGDGVATSVRRLKDLDAKSRIVILLSDGSNTAGKVDPVEASQAAATLGIKIYTIAVGSNRPVPFPSQGFFGGTTVSNQVLKVDYELLEKIAQTTGARGFTASNTKDLIAVYNTIDKLEKSEVEIEEYKEYEEVYQYFLWPGLLLLLLEILLGLTRFRSIP